MIIPKKEISFRQIFFHPRVFIFILIGTLIIFLTFFTDNNAIEIAISGIASVFIGIGVNNLSAIETQAKDEKKLQLKIGYSLKVMQLLQIKIKKIGNTFNTENNQKLADDFEELNEFMNLSIELLKESNSLK